MADPKHLFSAAIQSSMGYECPAVQGAIDNIANAEFRGRDGMIETLSWPIYRNSDFLSAVQGRWKDKDLKHATGLGRDGWLKVASEFRDW